MIKSLHFFTANLFKCLILQCVGGLKALVNMAMNLPSGIPDCVLYEVMLPFKVIVFAKDAENVSWFSSDD